MISSSAQLAAGGQAVGDRLDDLADQRDVRRLERERVEHGVDAALERVLDRRERPLDPPFLHREHDVAQRRERHGLRVGRRRGQRLVADGAGRAEVGDPQLDSRITDWTSPPASASRTASSSSGESWCSPRPAWICLQYRRAVSRCAIEESTTPL